MSRTVTFTQFKPRKTPWGFKVDGFFVYDDLEEFLHSSLGEDGWDIDLDYMESEHGSGREDETGRAIYTIAKIYLTQEEHAIKMKLIGSTTWN